MLRDLRFALGVARRRPFNCLVQVTNRCNMKCSFCDFWPHPAARGEELTVDDYRRVSDELAALGCFLISIEGGEPMVRPDLVDIVEAFSRHHLTHLFTNGWYVDAERAKALFGAGLTHASVSIDYPDPARHDARRRLAGTWERAWRAVDHFKAAAPHQGRQVHVMTVLMEDNWTSLEALLQQTAERGVGQQVTLLSVGGDRRGAGDRLPPPDAPRAMLALWRRHRHLRFFGDYFERMESFLSNGEMPTCRAGLQSFNLDHVGNLSACIERIHRPYGNVKTERVVDIHARMAGDRDEVERCQACWTACRGVSQALGAGGTLRAWTDLATRMRPS